MVLVKFKDFDRQDTVEVIKELMKFDFKDEQTWLTVKRLKDSIFKEIELIGARKNEIYEEYNKTVEDMDQKSKEFKDITLETNKKLISLGDCEAEMPTIDYAKLKKFFTTAERFDSLEAFLTSKPSFPQETPKSEEE